MPKEEAIQVEGTIVEPLPNAMFRVELDNGQPILVTGIVANREELIQQLGFTPDMVVEAQQTGLELFAWHVSAWSSLLILIGIGGIYFEMKSPGFGLGIGVALTAFGIFFFGNFFAGNLAGYELATIFVLGLILIIVELTIFPSLILGLVGSLLMIGALLFAMVDRFDFQDLTNKDLPDSGTFLELLAAPMLSLSVGLIGGIILILLMMRFLPHIPIPGIMLHSDTDVDHTSPVNDEPSNLVGLSGTATMDLRPVGKAKVNDLILDVITSGEFIPKDSPIKIIAQEKMRTIVALDE